MSLDNNDYKTVEINNADSENNAISNRVDDGPVNNEHNNTSNIGHEYKPSRSNTNSDSMHEEVVLDIEENDGTGATTKGTNDSNHITNNNDSIELQQYKNNKNEYFSEDIASSMDGPWIPFIPKLTLSVATILFAIIGITIGSLISIYSDPAPKDWVLDLIYYPGNLWVRGLKLLVLPLIICLMIIVPSSIINAASNEGEGNGNNGGHVSRMGKLALQFYLFTSFTGAVEGTIWGNLIRPGDFGDSSDLEGYDASTSDDSVTWYESILTIGENAIPSNIIEAMYDLNVLGIIVIFLVIGIFLRKIINENNSYSIGAIYFLNISKFLLRICMYIITYFIWFTPIGMLSLVTYKCSSTTNLLSLLSALGWYVLTASIAQFIHMFLFYPILFTLVTKSTFIINGWKHWYNIKQAPLVAFATSSSAATLSVSLKTCKEKGNVSSDVCNFIVPLGAAINMDGTGCGFPIMVLFIAQLYNINLNFGTQIAILFLSVICSIGTAPIPNAGMVYLVMLLEAAGNGLGDTEVVTTAVATLFLLDWFVDRIETAQNVTSDQFVAKMVDHLLQKEK